MGVQQDGFQPQSSTSSSDGASKEFGTRLDCPISQANAEHWLRSRSRNDPDHWLTAPCDDELVAVLCSGDEFRQLRLCFYDVHLHKSGLSIKPSLGPTWILDQRVDVMIANQKRARSSNTGFLIPDEGLSCHWTTSIKVKKSPTSLSGFDQTLHSSLGVHENR